MPQGRYIDDDTATGAPNGAKSSVDGTEYIPLSGNYVTLISTILSYIATAVSTFTNKTLGNTNTITVKDANFTIQDDSDTTKQAKFQASGITAGQTRTKTLQDTSGTIAETGNHLGAFAATTSAQLAGIISDETGSGALVFGTSPTITTPTFSGAISFPDDVRQTFNPGTNNAGLNVGAFAGDPSSPTNGDVWYDSTNNTLDARINGATVNLGAGGGSVATDTIWDAKGDVAGGTGSNTAARLAVGTDGQVLTADSAEATGLKWTTPGAGTNVSTDTIWDAKGDLAGGTGSNTAARLAVGTNGQVLTADSGETTGLKWATPTSGLSNSSISPTTADVTASVNTRYFANVSGLTANRNFKLPGGTAGDQIILNITTGDDTYAFIVIGDTSITINGGSTATEWSRVFIAGENVHLVATSSTNWQVVVDGRIPCKGQLTLSAADTTNTAATDTAPTWDTKVIDVGNIGDTTNFRFNMRRAAYVRISGSYLENSSITDGFYLALVVKQNSTNVVQALTRASATSANFALPLPVKTILVAAGDTLTYYYNTEQADRGIINDAPRSFFQVEEIF